MKNLITVTSLLVLTALSLLLSVKANAQTVEEVIAEVTDYVENNDSYDYQLVEEFETKYLFGERLANGVLFLDFVVSENVYDVMVFRVTESGEKILYEANYVWENKAQDFTFFCKGDFYAAGLGEESVVAEMYFSVTEDMVVSDGNLTYTMELK